MTALVQWKKNRIIYPEINLPLEVIMGMDLKVDDNVIITCKGRISGMEDTKWRKTVTIEARQGEVKKSGKKGENVIEEA